MKNRNGVTLIELLAVMTIIGVLLSLMIVGLSDARKRGMLTKAHAETGQLSQAWKAYWTVYGKWPASCEGVRNRAMDSSVMNILMGNNATENPKMLKFMEPNAAVLSRGFLDPWGKLYVVNFFNTKRNAGTDSYETVVYFPNKKRSDYDPKF